MAGERSGQAADKETHGALLICVALSRGRARSWLGKVDRNAGPA